MERIYRNSQEKDQKAESTFIRRRLRISSHSNSGNSPDGENLDMIVETAKKRTKRLRQTSTSMERSIGLLHWEVESLKREMAHLPGLKEELSGLREELKGKFMLNNLITATTDT